jgi:flagellar hook-basal body complex protein FliE
VDVNPILSQVPSIRPETSGGGPGKLLDGFGQALSGAVESLNQTQQAADQQAVQLAAGEPVELHDVMIAQEQASLGMQLAVQVRNKLVEAYQDVMRMQI